jgi:hypothetical protein
LSAKNVHEEIVSKQIKNGFSAEKFVLLVKITINFFSFDTDQFCLFSHNLGHLAFPPAYPQLTKPQRLAPRAAGKVTTLCSFVSVSFWGY